MHSKKNDCGILSFQWRFAASKISANLLFKNSLGEVNGIRLYSKLDFLDILSVKSSWSIRVLLESYRLIAIFERMISKDLLRLVNLSNLLAILYYPGPGTPFTVIIEDLFPLPNVILLNLDGVT